MNFNSLKQTIFKSMSKINFSNNDDVNRIIASALELDFIERAISSELSYSNNISTLTDNYASTYKNIVESLKGRYVSYKVMRETVLGFNISNFLQINRTQINKIISLYQIKQEVKQFNPIIYSQFMYDILKINDKQNERMEKIHFKIIVPVMKYFIQYENIKPKNITLENVNSNNPGKQIDIAIDGISPTKILGLISEDIFSIKSYLYKYEITSDNFVRLTIK